MGYLLLLLIWYGIIMAIAAVWSIIEDVCDWLRTRSIEKSMCGVHKNTDIKGN